MKRKVTSAVIGVTLALGVFGASTTRAQEPEEKSADEIARELANPNTPLATLNFKNQLRWFKGDLPGADSQFGYTMLFQPSLPFPVENGGLVFFRPAIPLLIDQPTFDASDSDFDSEFGIGDIAFDLAYGRTEESGLLWAAGLISTVPTATSSDIGSGQWSLGPELLLAKLSKTYVLGAFPNHQWDVAGWSDNAINLTTSQFFATYLPGGGWNVGSSPIISYDWHNEEWTVPVNFTVGKTVMRKGRAWKFSLEINYYIDQPDAFGPEWMIGINIAPVVKNSMTKWFSGSPNQE